MYSCCYHTRFFLQRGCCCQGREVVPVDHIIRGKGLSSRLSSRSKIRLTAGFEPCPQGPAPSSLAAAHSPFQSVRCTCFVHSIPVHSSLALRHHILRRTLLPWPIDYLHLPNWTVCAGVVGVALSAKMGTFSLMPSPLSFVFL